MVQTKLEIPLRDSLESDLIRDFFNIEQEFPGYPNPASNILYVEYDLGQEQKVSIDFYNLKE